MNSVFQFVKASQLQARKDRAKVAADLLTTLLGEIQRTDVPGAPVADDRVFSVTAKTLAGVETIHGIAPSEQTTKEIEILKQILAMKPAPASDKEVLAALEEAKSTGVPQNIGALMKHVKSKFPVIDGAKVSALIKSFIG